jgi:ABC-2 type transport system ATP-binding protein
MHTVIETNNLIKRYGNITAVDDLSMRVAKGEIYAFLGLNGAGKTTTIRLLLGMVKPTSGEAHVLSTRVRVGERKPWRSVGYLVETADAYPELTVRENLEAMRRLRPGTESQAVDRVIGQLGLHAYADRRTNTLSHGNAQRLGLAKALLHNPELIILDEPANGLDPAGIVEIRNLLIELTTKQGVRCRGWRNVLALFIKGDCCRNSLWMNLNAIGGGNLSSVHEIIRRHVQCL